MNSAKDNPPTPARPPVIILGAARSGTKLLRALVAATGQYAEVPFDLNYIWRYGNETCPHDALAANQVTDRTRRFVQKYLPQCAVRRDRNSAPRPFVEKTVSNILRVPFVNAIYPRAKFIAIVRDGRDVVESAQRCWHEAPRAGYLWTKLRTFPWRHCAPYGWKFAVRTVRRRLRIDKHLQSWGPRYTEIDDDVQTRSLREVCARQWLACMEKYEQSRGCLRPKQLLELRYEELVQSPQAETNRLCNFLEIDDRGPALEFARQNISADRLGSSRRLQSAESQHAFEIIQPALERWNYTHCSTRTA
jgi:hypothetical protein